MSWGTGVVVRLLHLQPRSCMVRLDLPLAAVDELLLPTGSTLNWGGLVHGHGVMQHLRFSYTDTSELRQVGVRRSHERA